MRTFQGSLCTRSRSQTFRGCPTNSRPGLLIPYQQTILMATKLQYLEFHFKISLEVEGRRNKWAWPTQAEESVVSAQVQLRLPEYRASATRETVKQGLDQSRRHLTFS